MLENKLRAIRQEKEIAQVHLAEAVEVSRQTIHSIETCKYVPSVELALKIAQFLNLNVEDIFEVKGHKRRGK
jgi:putative transcriptional regulator